MKNSKFYLHYIEQIEVLKHMTWKQRLDHIWSYYKEYMLVALMIIFLIVAIVIAIISAQTEVLFSGMFANVDLTEDGVTYLQEGYLERLGGGKDREVRLSATYFEDLFSSVPNFDHNYSAAMGTIAMVGAQSLDYVVMDETALKFYLSQDIFMDLREFFTESELAQLESQLVYLEAHDSEEKFPVAIHIEDTAIAKECMDKKEVVFLAFIANTKRLDTCRDFWEYLNSWKPTN